MTDKPQDPPKSQPLNATTPPQQDAAPATAAAQGTAAPAAPKAAPKELRLAGTPQAAAAAGGPALAPAPAKPTKAPWQSMWHVSFGMIVVFVLVGGFGGWAVFSQIAGAVIAMGQIEVDQNRQVVQHPDGGVVETIIVDEGDTVAADQVLIRLDGTLLRSELAIIESQYYELVARRGRLEAERDNETTIEFDQQVLDQAAVNADVLDLVNGQERLFNARVESLDKEVEQLGKRRNQIGNQIEGIEAQQAALGRQLELLRDELTDQTDLLDKGLAQKSRILALQREEARLAGSLGELVASKAESEGRITELELEIDRLRTRRTEEAITRLRDLQFRELELAEQRRSLSERLNRLDIKAPVSGIVYGLQVFAERSVIRPADPVLFLVPQDRPLVIATRVEPIHIDQVFPGQEVIVRFSALDARTTPELTGEITQVSADAFTDDQVGMSYYRAEVVLQDGEAEKLPGDAKLLPGMPVEAYLRTDDRSPLVYLIKPLADYFNKAFRES